MRQLRVMLFSSGDSNSLGALPPNPRSLSQGTQGDEPPSKGPSPEAGLGLCVGSLLAHPVDRQPLRLRFRRALSCC